MNLNTLLFSISELSDEELTAKLHELRMTRKMTPDRAKRKTTKSTVSKPARASLAAVTSKLTPDMIQQLLAIIDSSGGGSNGSVDSTDNQS
mgnify:CR=1 FL=1